MWNDDEMMEEGEGQGRRRRGKKEKEQITCMLIFYVLL